MATAAQVADQAQAVVDCSNTAKSLMAITGQALDHNSALSIDWNSLDQESIDAIAEITGASASEISNAIGSLSALQTYWGTHGGNFEKLAKAIT